jgi:hypothetical protein
MAADSAIRELIAELTTKSAKSAKRSKTACFCAFFAFFAVAQEFCNWLSDFGVLSAFGLRVSNFRAATRL